MFQKEKLLKDVEKAFNKWDERSQFVLKGVRNLSVSDLDTLELYAETGGHGLMKPHGYVGEVLAKYGYVHPSF